MKKALIAIAGAGLLASACASDGDNTQAYRQGAAGAAIGAVAGAIIGNNVGDGNAGRGAAIGAVVGGVAGVARGSAEDRRNQRYDDARGIYCYPEGDCYYPDGRRYR
ncbi:MAG: YMGG-like glycine zipper-containing protein [Pseudomonadota bacterium]